ncbi:hypothetical protein GGR92_000537 [Spirosoma lacussanchae]|uniref:acyl-CoA reductase n=1 Tax=Spirosoma lacussanchae TaxID=1884249 RepID=UPI0011093FAE|nr:acyl-CoA reductase [Spirosoma lacussanchae]
MLQSERLQTFIALGDFLRSAEAQPELTEIAHRAHARNNWFTVANSLNALSAIADEFLTAQKLTDWASSYRPEPDSPKQVGVVMAGNIPAVGFHDLLCVLMSGHTLLAKLSSQDFVLIHYLIQKIKEFNPAFDSLIVEAERLNAAEAYIATGSNNSARYFDYYFASKPHIIRKNRSSVALLIGEESDDELLKLDHDLSGYYGLGCRNVSTLLVPEGYDFTPLLRTLEPLAKRYLDNHKYQNNYDYNKSIYLINGVPHYDNGYLLVTENDALVSPISVVYYHTYQTQDDARDWLDAHKSQIQVVASAQGWLPGSVPFGRTQRPGLTDYADGIDTMAFLSKL